MSSEPVVVSSVQYVDPEGPPPAMWWRPRPEGIEETRWLPHQIEVRDIRGREADYSLEEHGFAVVKFDAEIDLKAGKAAIERDYYPACCALVKAATGAAEVYAFDHNYRSSKNDDYDEVADKPAYIVHNDYTESSASERVRVELGEERADELLKKRFAFVNVWRPVHHPAEDLPLGVIAANSIVPEDFITCAMYWPERHGETWVMKHNPAHEWYYASRMATDEALLLKCYDSATDGRARYAPHSAFQDPTAPPDARPRESVECRTVAFFD